MFYAPPEGGGSHGRDTKHKNRQTAGNRVRIGAVKRFLEEVFDAWMAVSTQPEPPQAATIVP